jgi:hypothetical protein
MLRAAQDAPAAMAPNQEELNAKSRRIFVGFLAFFKSSVG